MEKEVPENLESMSHEERVAAAMELKTIGNEAFKKKLFARAMTYYGKAIATVGLQQKEAAPILCNRAMCHLRVENFQYAIEDGEAAVAADPTFPKGYFRQSTAYYSIGKLDDSIRLLKTIRRELKLNSGDVNKKLKELQNLKKEIAFFDSIQMPDFFEKLLPEDILVEESYAGPRLDSQDADITLEWAKSVIDWMKDQKKLHKKYVWMILKRISIFLAQESTLIDVEIPNDNDFIVCGDIHGQFYDLLHIWETNGLPCPEKPYLFNGDFVDRGSFSVECILALYIYKLANPGCLYMNRGNHEGRDMNKLYGFEGEVKAKYCSDTFDLFAYSFDRLSLCHVLNSKVFVCHGGVFQQDGVTLDDLRTIKREIDIPSQGVFCDMLWSDPCKEQGKNPSKRGVSFQFGPDVAQKFLDDNGLELLVRSHEVKQDGYEVEADGRVITIFSAPNYCDQSGNKAAVIRFRGSEMTPHFVQFEAQPHPNVPAMHYARSPGMFR